MSRFLDIIGYTGSPKGLLPRLAGFLLSMLMGATLVSAGCGSDTPLINPGITNLPPIAIVTVTPATAVPNTTITMDGSGSFDPEHRTLTSYVWTQTQGTAVTLSSSSSSIVTFTVPNVTTVLGFELVVVDDANNASAPVAVTMTITGGAVPPSPTTQDAVYVSSTNGSDAAGVSGNFSQPVKTITHALSLAATGGYQNVYLFEGTYEETVTPLSGINIHGCVTGVDASGTPQFSQDPTKTIIETPAGALQAINFGAIGNVTIECAKVVGAAEAPTSLAINISNSSNITLRNVIVTTPGKIGATCRDIKIAAATNTIIEDSQFTSGGICNDYAAIEADSANGLTIARNNGTASVTIAAGGQEQFVKAVSVTNCDNVAVEDIRIQTAGTLANTAVFTAIAAGDTTGLMAIGNLIEANGGDTLQALSLRCSTAAADATVSDNSIALTDAATALTGIAITCPQNGSQFAIERNRMHLVAEDASLATLAGISATALLRSINLTAINNMVSMPVTSNDQASKSGVALTKLGASSVVSAIHNTFLITGSGGELFGITSDRTDVMLDVTNTIALIYGSNAHNALFSIPALCANTRCARTVKTNLINANIGGHALPLAYYYNAGTFEILATANECNQAPIPLACTLGNVDHRGNVLQNNLKPAQFDFDAGELVAASVGLVKNAGTNMGISVDIDGSARTDGQPDIGATEY